MVRGKFDVLDMLAFPIFSFTALTDNGLLPHIEVLGWSASDVLWSAGAHTEITWATLISILALTLVIATNRPKISVYGGIQSWIILTTAVLVIAPPFVPLLDGIIVSSNIVGFLAFTAQSSGYLAASWMG